MTEQEYCDVSDLTSCRDLLAIITRMNCYDEPDSQTIKKIERSIMKLADSIEQRVQESLI